MSERSSFKIGLNVIGPLALAGSLVLGMMLMAAAWLFSRDSNETDGIIMVAAVTLSAAGLVSMSTGLISLIADFQNGGRPVIIAAVTIVIGIGFVVVPLLAAFAYFFATTAWWNLS